jgi:hypothetical protein
MASHISHSPETGQSQLRLPAHLNTPLYRLLSHLGLFQPLRRISRRIFRYRIQRRALRGYGLVPEAQLRATYTGAVMHLKDRFGDDIGDYLEFGVCHGSSMACMHDVLGATGVTKTRLFGFDSFEGLPPEADHQDDGFFSRGQFDSDINFTRRLLTRRGIDWERTFLIRGWFRDTCSPALAEYYSIRKVGVVMIDCDICSAATEALEFVAPLLAEQSVIVFDDWNSGNLAERNLGEKKAFTEFLEKYGKAFHVHQMPSCYDNSAVFLLTRMKGFYGRQSGPAQSTVDS